MQFSNSIKHEELVHKLAHDECKESRCNFNSRELSGLEKQTDAVLKQVLGPYLEIKDLVRLSNTSKHFCSLFNQKLRDAEISDLLTYVVRGNFDKVKRMVENKPRLLLISAKATDYSGRTIYGTAYQMALGAVDTQMAAMIKYYLIKVAGEDEVSLQYKSQFPEGWIEVEEELWMPVFSQLEVLDQTIRIASDNEITNIGGDKLSLRNDEMATIYVQLSKFHKLLDEIAKKPISSGRHFNPSLLLEIFRLYTLIYLMTKNILNVCSFGNA